MISEQITVTATPTTIAALIATARGEAVPDKCVGILFRYAGAETALVTIADLGSSTGSVILDANTESLVNASIKQFSLSKALLSTNTGTVVVHVIVEQELS